MAKWKEFEQLVYQLQQQLSNDAEVVLGTHITGVISKQKRQIDILVKRQVGQYPMVIVMECKDHKRPVDIKEVEAFATKLKDVKANKGAIVSSKGFTSSALETAKLYGIDMFTFVDTNHTNWKSYASITASVERINFRAMQFGFSDYTEIPSSIIGSLPNVEVFDENKKLIGNLFDVMANKWSEDEIPKASGIHKIEIVKNGFVGSADNLIPLSVDGIAHVEKKVFHGPLPVDLTGLKDEQNGGVLTRSFTTKMIEMAKLKEGSLEGWEEVANPYDLAVEPMMTFIVETELKVR